MCAVEAPTLAICALISRTAFIMALLPVPLNSAVWTRTIGVAHDASLHAGRSCMVEAFVSPQTGGCSYGSWADAAIGNRLARIASAKRGNNAFIEVVSPSTM